MTDWRRPAFCDTNACAEVRMVTTDGVVTVSIRHSISGRMLTFTEPEWRALTAGFKAGEFDLPAVD
jgi:hypothetical protein